MMAKNQIYVSILIFFFLILILFFFIILPILKEIKVQSKELILLRQKIAFTEKRFENIEKLRKAGDEIEQFLEKTKNIFVNKEVPIEFINFLEGAAKDCEVFIKMVPVEKQVKETKNAIYLQIVAISSFPKISCFLEKIEAGQYLIEILGLEFNRLTENDLKTKELSNFSLGSVKGVIFFKALGK